MTTPVPFPDPPAPADPDRRDGASTAATVLVMLKAPRPGAVKTRLAAAIGDAAAVRVHRRLAERQLAAIPPGWPVEVHFAPADAHDEMRRWLGARPHLFPQPDGDLGRRLAEAVAGAFARGHRRLLVVGGDCPELDDAVLAEAACALDRADVVLVPALDGGYCLLGLRAPQPHLFHDIPWSTDAVLARTLERARERGLAVAVLPPLADVDTLEDLRRAAPLLGEILPDRD